MATRTSRTSGTKAKRSRSKGGAVPSLGTRPMWSGNLRLALVSVPVKIYPATRAGAHISFHQVHKPSGKRVHYQKVVQGIGPVDTDEIVKGFELEKGRYVAGLSSRRPRKRPWRVATRGRPSRRSPGRWPSVSSRTIPATMSPP